MHLAIIAAAKWIRTNRATPLPWIFLSWHHHTATGPSNPLASTKASLIERFGVGGHRIWDTPNLKDGSHGTGWSQLSMREG